MKGCELSPAQYLPHYCRDLGIILIFRFFFSNHGTFRLKHRQAESTTAKPDFGVIYNRNWLKKTRRIVCLKLYKALFTFVDKCKCLLLFTALSDVESEAHY